MHSPQRHISGHASAHQGENNFGRAERGLPSRLLWTDINTPLHQVDVFLRIKLSYIFMLGGDSGTEGRGVEL